MADVFLDNDRLQVVLSPLEHVGALHGDLEFPVSSVRSATTSSDPFAPVRGLRAPGTGWPGGIALGTWRSRRHGRTFAAAYRHRPALVIDLDDAYWSRLVVSTDDADRLAAALS